MSKIIDKYGKPFNEKAVAEPQTASIRTLQNTYIENQLGGLTPASAARILLSADQGDITAQHRLFDDMYDRDAHLQCEFSKRTVSLITLDWSISPPSNPSAAEKSTAAWAEEVLRDVVDDLEDLIVSLSAAVGHGFAPVEMEWARMGKELIPKFHPRPQDWFRLSSNRHELRLNDGSAEGAQLVSMGWIMHAPGKAKTGYLSRMGLFRVLLWPFIYKSYAIGDLAEFLETYGLPIILGKYYQGAQPEEKASLMHAVTRLGHDARAIMPKEMEIEINKVTGSGDTAAHLAMVDWAERSQSKAILGQVLSAEAKATGMGSGVADLQGEVRKDIRKSDARQIANTLTRDLVYPLIAFNRPGVDGLRRCPRFEFDLGEAEDIDRYATALPKLAQNGVMIPVSWVHEKLRIPQATENETVFGAKETPEEKPIESPMDAKLGAVIKASTQLDTADKMQLTLGASARLPMEELLRQIETMLGEASSLEEFRAMLLTRYNTLDNESLLTVMTAALSAVHLRGRAEVLGGN